MRKNYRNGYPVLSILATKQIGKHRVLSVFVCLMLCGQIFSQQLGKENSAVEERKPWFDTLNSQQKEEFREERYEEIYLSLKQTTLAVTHKELLAHGLSKLYVGIPLCTYESSHDRQGELFEASDNSGKWEVIPRGTQRFRGELPDGHVFKGKSLRSPESPFIFVPSIPFDIKHGSVIEDSETTLTFSFPLDTLLFEHSHRAVRWLANRAKWVVEFTINKEQQAPQLMKFSLAEPVKKPFRYSFNVVEVNMSYSFVESCNFHARTSLTVTIEGSAITKGKFVQKKMDSYLDIRCEEPLVYLRPREPRLNFLDHIFW